LKAKYFFTIGFVWILTNLHGQTPDTTNKGIFELEIGEILNISDTKKEEGVAIVSATKKAESLFEVPLGASVVTREEIQNAGCLSIVEALRLLPGVIVRETSAGNYDINIRGFNNLPPHSDFVTADNDNALIMIDNRPIYNYFSGGVFWESLPIDINDIERIELVRGPNAALYGPNAVTGVIHFITRTPQQGGPFASGNMGFGNYETLRANGSFGYVFENISVWASANYTQRQRHDAGFFNLINQQITPNLADLISYQTQTPLGKENALSRYPDPEMALDKFGMNTFLRATPGKKTLFELSMGLERSKAMRPFAENTYTPYSTMESSSKYVNLKTTFNHLTGQLSYNGGEQQPGIGVFNNHYDFSILDFALDYNIIASKALSINPGVSVRNAIYDDTKYTQEVGGILNASRNIGNISANIRFDYNHKNFRLMGAVRGDKFNVLEDWYIGYQLITSYKIKDKHLLRALYSKANRGIFMVDVFSDYASEVFPTADPNISAQNFIKGNKNLDLTASISMEVGYRFQVKEKFSLDLEVFRSEIESFIIPTQTTVLPTVNNPILSSIFTQNNIGLKAEQLGVTFSTAYTPGNKTYLKGFLSWQQTTLQNYIASENLKNTGTPSMYGGFIFNHHFSPRLSINLNGYYFAKQELTHIVSTLTSSPYIAEVKSKIILNFKFSYTPIKQFTVFATVRNLTNSQSFEYFYTDKIGTTFFTGFHFDLY
jgi:iron complex outermembrane recepter protein